MTGKEEKEAKAPQDAKKESAAAGFVVKLEAGVTFARKRYAKGDTIPCTEAQAKILRAQGVI